MNKKIGRNSASGCWGEAFRVKSEDRLLLISFEKIISAKPRRKCKRGGKHREKICLINLAKRIISTLLPLSGLSCLLLHSPSLFFLAIFMHRIASIKHPYNKAGNMRLRTDGMFI